MNTFDTHEALRAYLCEELRRLRDKYLATAPGQPVHATEVDYPYDTHAVRTADYNAIRWEIRNLQKSLRERDSERFNVEADATGATLGVVNVRSGSLAPVRRTGLIRQLLA